MPFLHRCRPAAREHTLSAAIGRAASEFVMWAVYDNPLDIPGYFVARKWVDGMPTQVVLQAVTLEELLDMAPPGLCRLGRCDADDPKVVEVWL